MAKNDLPRTPIVEAAAAFDGELERFSRLSDALARLSLEGEKHLERAAELLNELASSEERLGAHAQKLMSALTQSRDKQQAQAAAVGERAKEIEKRSLAFKALLERFQELGDEAAALNRLGQDMSEQVPLDRAGAERALLPRLDELHERMSALAEQSQKVAEDAKGAGFQELSRKAHDLRQQLLSARNKVSLLQQKLTS
jgi:uncharacterized phage infection (PIP) family protein YhgE